MCVAIMEDAFLLGSKKKRQPNIMANTYTQIHIQCVAAVKYRQSLIQVEWKEVLHKYITGIVQENGHKMIAINTMPDHLHFLIGLRPDQSLQT